MNKVPRILVVLPTANITHRQILNGMLKYARRHGPCQFHFITGGALDQDTGRIRNWDCTGIVALSHDAKTIRSLIRTGIPTVVINPPVNCHAMAVVQRDQRDVGITAANYFLELGFTSFAFLGAVRPTTWSDERLFGFRERLARVKIKPIVYEPTNEREPDDLVHERPRISEWLLRLPNGTALFTVHDTRAIQVLDICLAQGIKVPEDIAVLSVDNDELLCETTTPPLSSISLDGEHTGHVCAELIDRITRGERVDPIHVLKNPRIVVRQSTDATCISDYVIGRVLSYIRAHIGENIRISTLPGELGLSMRTIEMRALRVLGCTLQEQIMRMRLDEAVRLLSNTDRTVDDIARSCGFCNASHLGHHLKKIHGKTAAAFRT